MSEHDAAAPQAEVPDNAFAAFLGFFSGSERRIIGFLLAILLLGGAGATATVSGMLFFGRSTDAAADSRIDLRVMPKIDDHEKRLDTVEAKATKSAEDLQSIREDLSGIRQMLNDRLPARGTHE